MDNPKINDLLRDIDEMASIDCAAEFGRVGRKVRKKRGVFAGSIAVSCLAFAAGLFFLIREPAAEPEAIAMRSVEAPAGQVLRHVLPDSSVVWLNACSRIEYPETFCNDTRDITLEGEGYFHVSADPQHPFYVHTGQGMTVYVYGTKFGVSAYPDDSSVKTVLEEGHVNVLLSDSGMKCVLEPGQLLTFNQTEGTFGIESVALEKLAEWHDCRLVFRRSTIPEMMEIIRKHFDVPVTLENTSGRTSHFHASFVHGETFPEILDILSRISSLRWKEDGKDAAGKTRIKIEY